MPKYLPSDDGKVVDGRIVVFLHSPSRGTSKSRARPADVAKRQAMSFAAAARDGVPFCEACEKARHEFARQLETSA